MDTLSRRERSRLMARIKSSGNKSTEVRLTQIMRRFGIKGWRRGSRLFGKPDFVFPKCKVAIFVDGDFWHGNPACYRIPKTSAEYWERKIQRNIERDEEVKVELVRIGWRVLRLWESNLKDEYAVAARISFELGTVR